MGPLKQLFNQTRKPEGILGKLMVGSMNGGHAKLADWGMAFLPELSPDHIVDIGCGGGRNLSVLLEKYPAAYVEGIDHSPLSVKKSSVFNAEAIKAGRCAVCVGNVSALESKDDIYDLATAFETVYFWPGLEKCFSEVRRVLKPGGAFLIVNESDGEDNTGRQFEKIIDGMKIYSADELKAALKTAGFSEIMAHHHEKKPWIAIQARK